jgi:hypothetical protein
MYLCVYVCMYVMYVLCSVRMYVCMYVCNVCMYMCNVCNVRMYVCTYVRRYVMYVFIYVCMCVCTQQTHRYVLFKFLCLLTVCLFDLYDSVNIKAIAFLNDFNNIIYKNSGHTPQ